ncbi:hypothetical protein [Maritimibacter sp. DP1N21-5]|uniref:hypothetical protein n=1 Tax=Maritimibacter sp. DP1N21-5 TaxID=2836867 RepID=UPI001C43F7A8|nr:hypothetical protein [Maritimibacter sp. DP1N21-5]MBV7408708.1 hypothetical protein [Maritimibacter sp. DP1N21-5]
MISAFQEIILAACGIVGTYSLWALVETAKHPEEEGATVIWGGLLAGSVVIAAAILIG